MNSPLQDEVDLAFTGAGALARQLSGFTPRSAQRELARAITATIEQRGTLVAEAGTGTGKTFAYLVPLLLSGTRALVSTATKGLQDQLYLRDLPAVRSALGLTSTLALLKGRSSYLCVHRLAMARESALLADRGAVRTLARIETWAPTTSTGDFSELPGLEERSSALALASSTRDNCLGGECPEFNRCHVVRARRAALAADLVVINHHLYFADLAVRSGGMGELLPEVETVVFDEAHQVVPVGVQFLGETLGSGPLIELARDLLAAGLQQARGLRPWAQLSAALEQGARELRLACQDPERPPAGVQRWAWREWAGQPALENALSMLDRACQDILGALVDVAASGPDFQRLAERARGLHTHVLALHEPVAPGRVRWVDVGPQSVRLTDAPLDLRAHFQTQREASGKAWIFTSATLGDDPGLRWFVEPAGLEDARVLRVPSPFDFAAHARLYVPRDLPKPSEATHGPAVAELASRLADALGGRCFVLTTTLRALHRIAQVLRERAAEGGHPWRVLAQGEMPKRQLLQDYLADPACILVASHSFWEGIDVPGEDLQCVLIDKLPFPPPGDPWIEARARQLQAQGRDAFEGLHLPETAVALQQGVGRLIRSERDRGLIVIADPRMATMGYGRRLLAALPPATRLAHLDEALDYLQGLQDDRLTRAATTSSRSA